ncbi:MAG: hypothetical protein A3E83_08655 [Gammaproteobacteria bacterium RIFCSPHIGHO2_12_FULL_41_20]|nr:MAG: hypothetical protein A3E83_08655 [Gammaproteobacteria bacterium RIFCSPHIGHO2_12_FULL_41_20]
MKKFKAYLVKQKERVIKTGFHFNNQLFAKALKIYDEHYAQFGGFDSKKNRLAAIKVIGVIQGLFTTNLAQTACDGFGKVIDERLALSRALKLERPPNFPFFHTDWGVSHFVYSFHFHTWRRRLGSGGGPGLAAAIAKLMSSKNIELGRIIRGREAHRRTSRCSEM